MPQVASPPSHPTPPLHFFFPLPFLCVNSFADRMLTSHPLFCSTSNRGCNRCLCEHCLRFTGAGKFTSGSLLKIFLPDALWKAPTDFEGFLATGGWSPLTPLNWQQLIWGSLDLRTSTPHFCNYCSHPSLRTLPLLKQPDHHSLTWVRDLHAVASTDSQAMAVHLLIVQAFEYHHSQSQTIPPWVRFQFFKLLPLQTHWLWVYLWWSSKPSSSLWLISHATSSCFQFKVILYTTPSHPSTDQ